MAALLLAPISWAFGSAWSHGRDLPPPFMSTAAQMVCAAVAMTAVGLLLGERIHEWPPLRATLAVAYLAAFGSILGFSAYVWLLHHVRPSLATSYAYVNPPIAVLLGALLLGERVDAHTVGAMAVILLGVAAIARAQSNSGA
jgi:drug/metabolite transporter (DMT)-like permease